MAVMRAEVRAAIVEDLKASKSQYGTAKRHGVSTATVSRIAKAEGIDSNVSATKKATVAHSDYALAGRLELSNELFAKLREMIPILATPAEIREASTAFGILTDKRRLEEGEATERHEYSDNPADRLARRMDELSTRRRAKGMDRESTG